MGSVEAPETVRAAFIHPVVWLDCVVAKQIESVLAHQLTVVEVRVGLEAVVGLLVIEVEDGKLIEILHGEFTCVEVDREYTKLAKGGSYKAS